MFLPFGDARTDADFAHEAELAGWDGFFVGEPVWGIDTWVALTAAAMRTERIRLGTLLTPLSLMRPWKLASETVTLDHLSGGRVMPASPCQVCRISSHVWSSSSSVPAASTQPSLSTITVI